MGPEITLFKVSLSGKGSGGQSKKEKALVLESTARQ